MLTKEKKEDQLLYKKSNLIINTNLDETNNELDEYNGINSNNYRFKTYISGIIKIQNLQDYIIKLTIVTSLFIIDCPHITMDLYFLDNNYLCKKSYIYLLGSITERIILGMMSYYTVMTNNLDDIYDVHYTMRKTPNLVVIGKIEILWSKYYSLIGIILAIDYFCINGYLNTTYMYILCFSILKLILLKILSKKNNASIKSY